MERKVESGSQLLKSLGLKPFEQRLPWLGGDLQTLRDTFRIKKLPYEATETIKIPVNIFPQNNFGKGYLLAFLDRPDKNSDIRGLVLMFHGLGGSSQRYGLRRMSLYLQNSGFAVLRLNLRGADPGRHLAGGTYSAKCNKDIFPVFELAKELSSGLAQEYKKTNDSLPLLGVGISLGGTILLNACLNYLEDSKSGKKYLDGLICTSSPLDLASCSKSIDKPRNIVYQKWLLNRLVKQTLADPFDIETSNEELNLFNFDYKFSPKTIREFDEKVTAPRWGYKSVDDYYLNASPFFALTQNHTQMPPGLILQAIDDPWVPFDAAKKLSEVLSSSLDSPLKVLLTSHGGHNGFHGRNGCWGDELVEAWFSYLSY